MPRSIVARLGLCLAAELAVLGSWLVAGGGGATGIAFLYVVPIGLATWWGGRRWGAVAVASSLVLYLVSRWASWSRRRTTRSSPSPIAGCATTSASSR